MQFSSMNTLAYADVEGADTSMASTLASSMQQLSMSFGLAAGSLVAGWFLAGLPQTDRALVTRCAAQRVPHLGGDHGAVVTVVLALEAQRRRSDEHRARETGGGFVSAGQAWTTMRPCICSCPSPQKLSH